MRLRRVLLFSGLTALVTGLLVYWLLISMVAPGKVLIAAANIGERAIITRDALVAVRLPRAAIHNDAIRQIEDAVGKSPMYPIAQGEQILRSKLSEGALAGRLSGLLAPGERAMLIPLAPDRAVGGAVLSHDRVDVIFVANSSRIGYQLVKTILSGVEVLDVRTSRGSALTGGAGDGVVVRVKPADAEQLSYAISNGDVYVTIAGYAEISATAPGRPNQGEGQ